MGCACFKTDVVIKSNKSLLHLSSNNPISNLENYSRRESQQNNLNIRNSLRNISNDNNNNNNYVSNIANNNHRNQNQSSLGRNSVNINSDVYNNNYNNFQSKYIFY